MIGTPILTIILIGLIVRSAIRVIGKRDAEYEANINREKEAHKSQLEQQEKEHQSQQSKLIEGHVTSTLALRKLHETEMEGLKKHFQSVIEFEREQARKQQEHHNALVSEQSRKIREQSSRILKLTKHTLIFEVEECPQCRVSLSHEAYTFDPPEGEPEEVDYYALNANVKIHFENNDTHQLMLKKRMEVSLLRKTGRGKEKIIPLQSQPTLIVMVEGGTERPKLEDLRFPPITKTQSYIFYFGMRVPTRYGKRLNHNCFIRITMEAMRQPPYSVDLDVNWEEALKGGSSMTPRK
jgi:hypothetical protein